MPRAVILTALPVEYLAVRTHLTDLQEEMHPQGTIYERGKFVANGRIWEVGIAEVGAGNAGAAIEAERAIAYFKPDVLLFVGIAGGIKDVEIGDVVAATKVYSYESGKVGEQFFTRPALEQSAHALVQRARAEARKGEWLKRLSSSPALQPCVLVAPIAAGEKVVASKESDVFNFIRASYNDAIAVEMEGFGFLSAAFAYPDVKAIVIRGIADLIESKNDGSSESSHESEHIQQEKASRHASAFALELLSNFQLSEKLGDTEANSLTPLQSFGNASVNTNLSEATQVTDIEAISTKVVGKGSTNFDVSYARGADQFLAWGSVPKIPLFFGRTHELNTLEEWVVQERCRLVTLLGTGGVGKSALALKLAQRVQKEFGNRIVWQSLINSPPIHEILTDLLKFLSKYQTTRFPSSTDEQIVLLTECLNQQRCLIILDNMESILHGGEYVGKYREGYEEYGKLLRLAEEKEHQSCFLLTSRESPREIVIPSEKQTQRTRSLQVEGLHESDGRKIFEAKGEFRGSNEDWKKVISNYSGNPLALSIAASAIQELLGGDISRYISQYLEPGRVAFKEIDDIIGRQFNRLSEAEKSIMYWLSINREPTSNIELQADILSIGISSGLPESMLSLKRRSLVESDSKGFTLQPVVIEYVTEQLIEKVFQEIIDENFAIFNNFALIKAQSKDYVRAAQSRLILSPIVKKLLSAFEGEKNLVAQLSHFLSKMREKSPRKPGYTGGNILNLLCYLKTDLKGYDFSNLCVWQAYLQDVDLHDVNFTDSDLTNSVFTQIFASVLSIAFSPNGRLLASGDAKGEIHLWQVVDGQPTVICKGHTSWVRSITFSSDSQTLASGSDDHTVRIWDARTGKCLKTFKGHTNHVSSVVFNSDDNTLVSGSSDSTIRLWDVNSGQCLKIMKTPDSTERIWAIAVSPDGKLIASGSEDSILRIWNSRTGQCVKVLHGHTKGIFSVAFNQQGILASGSDDETIKIWDIDADSCLMTLKVPEHIYRIWSVAFNRNGKLLASGSEDQRIRVWDITSGQCIRTFEGHTSWVWTIAFSPDGQTLASGSDDHTVRMWNVNTDQCLRVLQGYTSEIRSVAFSPDGKSLASGGEEQKVRIWDIDTGRCLKTLSGHTSRIWSVAFSPDRQLLASGCDDDTVRVWDVYSGNCLNVLQEPNRWTQAIAFSPDGQTLASSDDAYVKLWYVRTGQCYKQLQGHEDWVWSVAFSPLGTILASASDDGTVRVWHTNEGKCIRTLRGHESGVRSVAFSPSGKFLASGSDDRIVRLWDVNNGKCLRSLKGHVDWIWSVAFSPNGRILASGSQDQTIRLWDVYRGKCIQTLFGHTHWVRSVAFSPDGQLLASGGPDETIRLWDVATGRICKTMRARRPYEGMRIQQIKGLTDAQKMTLEALGATGD